MLAARVSSRICMCVHIAEQERLNGGKRSLIDAGKRPRSRSTCVWSPPTSLTRSRRRSTDRH